MIEIIQLQLRKRRHSHLVPKLLSMLFIRPPLLPFLFAVSTAALVHHILRFHALLQLGFILRIIIPYCLEHGEFVVSRTTFGGEHGA